MVKQRRLIVLYISAKERFFRVTVSEYVHHNRLMPHRCATITFVVVLLLFFYLVVSAACSAVLISMLSCFAIFSFIFKTKQTNKIRYKMQEVEVRKGLYSILQIKKLDEAYPPPLCLLVCSVQMYPHIHTYSLLVGMPVW